MSDLKKYEQVSGFVNRSKMQALAERVESAKTIDDLKPVLQTIIDDHYGGFEHV